MKYLSILLLIGLQITIYGQNTPEAGADFSSTPKKWSITFDPGVTNVNFAVYSHSGEFKLDGTPIGIDGNFQLYDSREAYFPPSIGPFTDQANHYLVSIKNHKNWILTAGVLHDKREQRPNIQTNTFRYTKGGFNFTLQAGKEWDKAIGQKKKNVVAFQMRGGVYASFNNINAHLADASNNTFISPNDSRKYSGGGLVTTSQLTYVYQLKKGWGIALSVNGTFMTGKAFSIVSTSNTSGDLSINYRSISMGPSVNLVKKWHSK